MHVLLLPNHYAVMVIFFNELKTIIIGNNNIFLPLGIDTFVSYNISDFV